MGGKGENFGQDGGGVGGRSRIFDFQPSPAQRA
jgi:hypothetical protein